MSLEVITQLVAILAPLSLIMVGGALTVMPEIHRQVVEVHGWLTSAEFAELFALAQAAPGPNVLFISLIGWKAAGWPGAVVALVAILGPASLLAYSVAQASRRLGRAPWFVAIRVGLAPLAIGLVVASGVVLGTAALTSGPAYLLAGVTVLVLLRTSLHPLLLMLVGAALAVAGWL